MTTSSSPNQPTTLVTQRDRFPFAVTSLSDPNPRPVFAHFMCGQNLAPYIASGSNDYWTTTATQVTTGSQYGALCNDRPIPQTYTSPRTVSNATQWQLFDLINEVRDAISAGISGFIVNSQGGPSANPTTVAGKHWTMVKALYDAAAAVDSTFALVLSPDFNTWCLDNPSDWASSVRYANSRGNKFSTNGTHFWCGMYEPWRSGKEWCTQAYFSTQKTTLAGEGILVHVAPTFNDAYVTITRNGLTLSKAAWADAWSDGIAEWGDRAASATEAKVAAFVAQANTASKVSIAPIGMAYHRRLDGFLPDTGGTLGLRNSITGANNAAWLQVITWNDFVEHTTFCVSGGRQLGPLTILAYLIHVWRTGSPPPIVRDKIVYFHTSSILSTVPSGQSIAFTKPKTTPNVEGWFFCTEAATVSVTQADTSISSNVSEGLTILDAAPVPNAVPVFKIAKGSAILELTSRYSLRTSLVYDDPTIKSSDSSDTEYTTILTGVDTMYGTRAEADAYFASRTGFTKWPSGDADPTVTPTVKNKLLTSASDILDALRYISTRTLSTQDHEWPRVGFDPTPAPVKNACFEIAYSLLDGKDPEMEFAALGIGGNQYGSVRTNYNQSVAFAHRLTGVLSRRAQVLIQPYLANDNSVTLVRG